MSHNLVKKRKLVTYVVPSLKMSEFLSITLIINQVVKKYDVQVVTIHGEESHKSVRGRFVKDGIKVVNLDASIFNSIARFKKFADANDIDLLHSQGLLSDITASLSNLNIPWVTSIRNYPLEDYPMKYGKLLGTIIGKIHLWALRK